MKLIKLREYLHFALLLVILALMWGCGHGGNEVVSKAASMSVIPSGNGVYVIQGDNLDGVAGIELTISYDSATLSSPTVTQGGFISGALMVVNSSVPGTIRIAIINSKAFTGSGQIATVSFAAVTGEGSVSIAAVKMVDIEGTPIP